MPDTADHALIPTTPATLTPAGGRKEETGLAIALPGGVDLPVPAAIAAEGRGAAERFGTFFTDNIRSKHTREAYGRAAVRFFAWCSEQGLSLPAIRSFHVSAYIEELLDEDKHGLSKPTVKQHLAAIRMLFDWLVVGQVCRENPAAAVRGPRHSVTTGKTPVLDKEETRRLLDAIDVTHVVGLRDRALIATMVFTFGRVEAVCGMDVRDYYPSGKRWRVRLSEKNGREHEMPVHHTLEEYLDAYLAAAKESEQDFTKKHPLFPTAPGRSRRLTSTRMDRTAAWKMVRRHAKAAGIKTPIGNHTFRGTGITNYLENGGTLAEAQKMAGHADPRTTKLYDRTGEAVSLDEVERMAF